MPQGSVRRIVGASIRVEPMSEELPNRASYYVEQAERFRILAKMEITAARPGSTPPVL